MTYEWLAGFFDGEGCIGMQEKPPHPPENKSIRYQPYISVGQKNIPFLKKIKRFLGYGGIFSGGLSCPHLTVPSKKLLSFLTHITPYLQVKTLQARLMLQFLRYREKGCGEHPLSEKELRWQKMHQRLISYLKRVTVK